MNSQRGDAGVSIMLVMMVVAIGFWMSSGSHGGHWAMSSTHDEMDTAMESVHSRQRAPVDVSLVETEVVQN
jgi:hypothetical protein